MNPTIKDKQLELLISLQKIDKEIIKFNQQKEKIPEEIERERQIFEKINLEINQLNEKIEQTKKERRSKELETQSTTDLLNNTKIKLPNVKTNKEYSAVLQEIENLKSKIDSLEEAEIKLMENIEECQKEYDQKLKEKEEEEKKYLDIKKRKEDELEDLNKGLEKELNYKNELAAKIESKWFKYYKKVMDARNGKAVVTIQNDTCSGCHRSLRPQLSIEIRQNDSIITCPYCSRFLFSEQMTGVG